MAFSCGFYNAVNHDRTYNATQVGDLFTGLINDGVYATVGHAMTVAPVSGMTVKVRSGRAWFNKTWNVNDSDYPLNIPVSDLLLPRVDAVVLEVDTRLAVRNNSLKVVKGRPANNPSAPTLTRANGLYQYPLAYVTVSANARNISASDIEVVVGRSPTPFVTGIVESADISDFWEQWDSQFHTWFDELRTNMSGDVAENLQAQIEQLKATMMTADNKATTSQAEMATNDATWMTPKKTLAFYNYRKSSEAEVKVDNPTEDRHFITPLILQKYVDAHRWNHTTGKTSKNDFVASYNLSEWFKNKAAPYSAYPSDDNERYVSPKYLKEVLADFSPSTSTPSPSGTSNIKTYALSAGTMDNCSFDTSSSSQYYAGAIIRIGSIFILHFICNLTIPNVMSGSSIYLSCFPYTLPDDIPNSGSANGVGYVMINGDLYPVTINYSHSGGQLLIADMYKYQDRYTAGTSLPLSILIPGIFS